MEFDAGLLKYTLEQIVSQAPPPRPEWTVQIVTPNEEIGVMALLAQDTVCNFVENFTEECSVEVVLGSGTVQHRILPYKENLKVKVIKTIPATGVSSIRYYQGLIIGVNSTLMEQKTAATVDTEVGDIAGQEVLVIQLREFALDYLQAVSVGGIFRNTTPAAVLRALLQRHGQDERLDMEYRIGGPTLQPPDNTEVRKQIIVDHGTPLISLGDFLQNKGGGIYSSGLGMFLLRSQWYLWGLYDLNYESNGPKLKILLSPPTRNRGLERTWMMNGSELLILAAGDRKHADPSDGRVLSDGNAVRFVDARQVVGGFSQTIGNRGVMRRTQNANEYAGFSRASGNTYSVTTKPTDNVYAEASRLVGRNGSYMSVIWERSEPEYLRPDMTCTVLVERQGVLVEVKARILKFQTYLAKERQGIINRNMQMQTEISLFLSNEYKDVS